jgi:hypothetical protein
MREKGFLIFSLVSAEVYSLEGRGTEDREDGEDAEGGKEGSTCHPIKF